MRKPEAGANGDALLAHEVRAVLPPGQYGFGGTRDFVDDAGIRARAAQDARDTGAGQRRLPSSGGDEALDFRPPQIEPDGGGIGDCGTEQPRAQHSCAAQPSLQARADHYEPTSFRV